MHECPIGNDLPLVYFSTALICKQEMHGSKLKRWWAHWHFIHITIIAAFLNRFCHVVGNIELEHSRLLIWIVGSDSTCIPSNHQPVIVGRLESEDCPKEIVTMHQTPAIPVPNFARNVSYQWILVWKCFFHSRQLTGVRWSLMQQCHEPFIV